MSDTEYLHDYSDDELSLLVVFDFDDTLFPTTAFATYLEDITTTRNNRGDIVVRDILYKPLSDIFLLELSELDDIVVNLLKESIFYGTEVIILTNARNGWVQAVVNKFYPKVKKFLASSGIPVVYARDTFGQFNSTEWKHKLLNHLYDWGQNSLLSIGDAIYDCERITLPDDIIKKCVKMVRQPTSIKLIQQLEELQDMLLWLLKTDENIMIEID
jgi:hypothetical protein